MLGNLGADYKEEELKARAAAERAALANINPDGGHYNVPTIGQGTHSPPSFNERLQLTDQQTQNMIQQGVSLKGPSPLEQFMEEPGGSSLAILGAYGEANDAIDKAAGIPGTPLNVYNARHSLIDPATSLASQVHPGLGIATNIAGEMLIPDTQDIATGGAGYIAGIGKGIHDLSKFLKIGKVGETVEAVTDTTKALTKGSELAIVGHPNPKTWNTNINLDEVQPLTHLEHAKYMEITPKMQNLTNQITAGAPTPVIRDELLEGLGEHLDRAYTYISADKLAVDTKTLQNLIKRNAESKALHAKWKKSPNTVNQRKWYDAVSKNYIEDDLLIYGGSAPRALVARTTAWASRDHWHHIFGNKEAGEFLLSEAAQDPLIAANLMAHMSALGLKSSGIASNIAIMKATGHRNLHKWLKKMGFESKVGKPADLAIDQYATEISKVATQPYLAHYDAAGKLLETPKMMPADPSAVNHLFGMLTAYKEANEFIKAQLRAGKIKLEDGSVLRLDIDKAPEIMSEIKPWEATTMAERLKLQLYNIAVQSKP